MRWLPLERPLFLFVIGAWVCGSAYVVWRPFRKLLFPPFRILVALMAAVAGYFLFARLVNTTTIRVDRGDLCVNHGPMPLRKGARVRVEMVAAITHGALTGVRARLTNGSSVVLLDDFAIDWERTAHLVGELCGRPVEPYRRS